MVSVCCEDCKAEKLKSNIFNKILINENCNIISDYLSCDDCCRMKAILNDPKYKSIHPENQQIFMLVKLFPFPDTIKDFKHIIKQYRLPPYFSKKEFREVKSLVNRQTFPMIKYYYDNMYIDMSYRENFIRNGCSKIIRDEMTKKGVFGWCSWKILMRVIKMILRCYMDSNRTFHFKKCCDIKTDDDFNEFIFWNVQQKCIF